MSAAASLSEFKSSGLTPEEFNKRQYRDDGELFASIEDGKIQLQSVILMPDGWGKKQIRPERVLQLYNDNLSLHEVAKSLERSEKWVQQNLRKLGIHFGPKGVRFDPSAIPFGWTERSGRLVPSDSEQWVLDKVQGDLKAAVPQKQICKSLNALKIKPRYGKQWDEEMLSNAVSKNKRLKSVLTPTGAGII